MRCNHLDDLCIVSSDIVYQLGDVAYRQTRQLAYKHALPRCPQLSP